MQLDHTSSAKCVDIPLDVLQEILRAPHWYFRSHSPRTAVKGRANICIWNIETITNHLEFQPVCSFSVPLRDRTDQKL